MVKLLPTQMTRVDTMITGDLRYHLNVVAEV